MPLRIRLTNLTSEPLEIEDGADGLMALPPRQTTEFPGKIAGPKLRRFLVHGLVRVEGGPPSQGESLDWWGASAGSAAGELSLISL
jgi:hypothetical protein